MIGKIWRALSLALLCGAWSTIGWGFFIAFIELTVPPLRQQNPPLGLILGLSGITVVWIFGIQVYLQIKKPAPLQK